jgi:hypothetical protein
VLSPIGTEFPIFARTIRVSSMAYLADSLPSQPINHAILNKKNLLILPRNTNKHSQLDITAAKADARRHRTPHPNRQSNPCGRVCFSRCCRIGVEVGDAPARSNNGSRKLPAHPPVRLAIARRRGRASSLSAWAQSDPAAILGPHADRIESAASPPRRGGRDCGC